MSQSVNYEVAYEDDTAPMLRVPKVSGSFLTRVFILLALASLFVSGLALPTYEPTTPVELPILILRWSALGFAVLAVSSYLLITLPFRARLKKWLDLRYGLDVDRKELANLSTPVKPFALGIAFESKQTFLASTGSYNTYVLTYDLDDEDWEIQDDTFKEYLELADDVDDELLALEHLANVLKDTMVFWRINPDSENSIYAKDKEGRHLDVFWIDKEDLLEITEDNGIEEKDLQFLTKNQMVNEVLPQLWMEDKGIILNLNGDEEMSFPMVHWVYALMKVSFPEFVRTYNERKGHAEPIDLEIVTEGKDYFLPFKALGIYTLISALIGTAAVFFLNDPGSVAIVFMLLIMFYIAPVRWAMKRNSQFADTRVTRYLRKNIVKWAKQRYNITLTRQQADMLTIPSEEEKDDSNSFVSNHVNVVHPIYNEPVECLLVQSKYKFLLVDTDRNELMPHHHSSAYSKTVLMKETLSKQGLYMLVTTDEETEEEQHFDGGTFLKGETLKVPLFWTSDVEAAHFASMIKKSDPEFNADVRLFTISDVIEKVLPNLVGQYELIGINWEVCIIKEALSLTDFVNLALDCEKETE